MSPPDDGARSTIDHRRVIAIDGPAAAGKSTVAHMLADRLGAMLFDTGALYRAVALAALRSQVAPDDHQSLARLARDARIVIQPPSQRDGRLYDVRLNEEDVTWPLRDPEVGAIVSKIAAHPPVRSALLPLQRRIASDGPVVMVGRDIGTVVVPDAGLKVYLDATPEERARRRHQEATRRGGIESYEDVLRETQIRDIGDSSRDTAPLRAAPDAIRINTDDMTIDNVVAEIESLARARVDATGAPLWPS
ncbi:MAG: (d)CMP kinase [Chloroflexi bacterium]|nr:(d)CMP kinase [Chloroflexota bacterium]